MVNVIKEGSIFLGDEIVVGSYKVKYKVIDSVGNNVKMCIINIIMKGKVKFILFFI